MPFHFSKEKGTGHASTAVHGLVTFNRFLYWPLIEAFRVCMSVAQCDQL